MSKKAYPQEIAEEIISSEDYLKNLIYLSDYDCFFLWSQAFPAGEGGYYEKLVERELKKRILKFCEARFPTQPYSDSTLKDIASLLRLKVLREYPCEDGKYISFNDCIFNMNTFEEEQFDREKISIHHLPYNFSETKMETPTWNKFLESSLVYENDTRKCDPSLKLIVQEMFGMFLLDNLKASSAFFLFGRKGANGKSQMTNIIFKIFGHKNCTALSLNDFTHKFALIDLIGSKVNIANELDEKFGNSRMFKALVSGDPIRAEYKFGGGIQFTPKTKFVFSTNKLPTFDGLDGGMRRRVKIIPFYRQFKDGDADKDYYLGEKLDKEIPGIVGWAIEGAKRLVENGFVFTASNAVSKSMDEFDREMSSALMFIKDNNYVADKHKMAYIVKTSLYNEYYSWSQEVNKKPMSRPRFYEDLENIMAGLEQGREYVEGTQKYVYYLTKVDDEDVPDWNNMFKE